MKKLAPIHLRRANLRRWLNKRVCHANNPNLPSELNEKDLTILLKMIYEQATGILSRLDKSNGKFDVVVHERNFKTIEDTKDFYILKVDLNSVQACNAYTHFLMVNHGIIETPFRS